MALSTAADGGSAQTPVETLGRSVFFDNQLSLHRNQSCAACHDPDSGGTGPIAGINKQGVVYPGTVRRLAGARKPPGTAYASLSPILRYVVEDGEALFIGGNFRDGRAKGERLGHPAADQALGPFRDPVEHALPDPARVVYRVCEPRNKNRYPVAFEDVWPGACEITWPEDVDKTCGRSEMVSLEPGERLGVDIAHAQSGSTIARFEGSVEINQYSSKYDAVAAGEAELTAQEEGERVAFLQTLSDGYVARRGSPRRR